MFTPLRSIPALRDLSGRLARVLSEKLGLRRWGASVLPLHLSGSRDRRSGNDTANEEVTGGGGQAPLGGLSLHLEDRLLVALSRRGYQRIGQFISNAIEMASPTPDPDAFYWSDELFVSACEDYANEIDPERAA